MKKIPWWQALTLIALIAGIILAFGACQGDDDDDDDDVGDDDAGDDDTGDDDTGGDDDDDQDYCETLTDEEKGLFAVYSLAGSSNTYHNENDNPYGVGDRGQYYPGKLLGMAWAKLGPCVDYEPEMWIFWYTEADQTPEDATLLMAVDAFYHYIDDDPDPETFRTRVQGYLTTVNGIAPDAPFFSANIPQLMMLSYTGDKQEINDIIAYELSLYDDYFMLDIDYYMNKLVAGDVTYDGDVIGPFDILNDLVHINEFGHQIVADMYITQLNEVYPNLDLPTYGEIVVNE